MTSSKAREILSDSLKGTWPTPNTDYPKAVQLGIEAIERHQVNRAPGRQDEYYLLPSETED